MKKIEAIIKPFKLDDVKENLKLSAFRALPSVKSKGLAVRRVTPSFTAVPSMSSTFCQR